MDLKITLSNICERWKYKMDEVSPGVFRIDVSVPYKDNTVRYQYVYAWIIKERYYGKDVVYINSRCGEFNLHLNLYQILKESGYGNYCSVTVTTDKRTDGSPCETVVVQAVQPIEFTNEDILNQVIYDVAVNADFIEKTYFGGDTN
jgi:hypothetical protein